MGWLRRFSFADLFGIACVVGAAFQTLLLVVGIATAVVSPGSFHTRTPHGMTSAGTFGQAMPILFGLYISIMLLNVLVAAVGAVLLVGVKALARPRA